MEEDLIKTLTESLDNFLDNSDDLELYNEYIKMLKEKSAYTFLYVLNRISYSRMNELLKKTNDIIQLILKNKEEILDYTSSTSNGSTSTTSDSSSEQESTPYRTGTMFDILMDNE